MATRYYTEEAYEQIRNTIETIQQTDVSGPVDLVSDLWGLLMQFLNILKVDNYKDDMQSWYNRVLDSHNTTISKVDAIFSAVETVDFQHRDTIGQVHDSIVQSRSIINTLRDVISGKTSLADGQAATSRYITSAKASLQSAADAVLTKLESKVLFETSKELLSDALAIGASWAKICGALCSGDFAGVVTGAKKFIDAGVATLSDLGSIASIVVIPIVGVAGALTGMDYGHYIDWRFQMLSEAKKYKDVNSVSDVLDGIANGLEESLADCPKTSPYYQTLNDVAMVAKGTAKVGDTVDILADAYDVYDNIHGAVKNVNELVHGKTTDVKNMAEYVEKMEEGKIVEVISAESTKDGIHIISKLQPDEVIAKAASNRTGIPFTGWDNPSKINGNIYKTVRTIWSYVEKVIPNVDGTPNSGEITDVFFKNFKEISIIKDIKDLIEDCSGIDLADLIPQDGPSRAGG